jgi:hypothetical protein
MITETRRTGCTTRLIRHGVARRATVAMGEDPLYFDNVGVWLDPAEGLAHLLDADMRQHLATIPLDSIIVEWGDLGIIRRTPHVTT